MDRLAREDRKKRRNAIWVGGFIIFIMITSVIGYMYGDNAATMERYGDYKFEAKQNSFGLRIDGQEYKFHYLPDVAYSLNITDDMLKRILGSVQMHFTSRNSDENKEAIAQAEFELQQFFNIERKVYADIGFLEDNITLPQYGCANATQYVPVIVFATTNESIFSMIDNCLAVGLPTGQDFLIFRDRIMYEKLGVKKVEQDD